jgi:hypothetical protein
LTEEIARIPTKQPGAEGLRKQFTHSFGINAISWPESSSQNEVSEDAPAPAAVDETNYKMINPI